MPINLKALQERGVDLEIEYFGEVGTVTYDPVKFKPGFRKEWQSSVDKRMQSRIAKALKPLQAKLDGGETLTEDEQQAYDDLSSGKESSHTDELQRRIDYATALCELVRRWDTIGIDGEPMALDPKVIARELPEDFVATIVMQIWLDVTSLGKSKKMKTG